MGKWAKTGLIFLNIWEGMFFVIALGCCFLFSYTFWILIDTDFVGYQMPSGLCGRKVGYKYSKNK